MSNKYKRHGKYKKHPIRVQRKSMWDRFKAHMLSTEGSQKGIPHWMMYIMCIIMILCIIFGRK